MRTPEIDMDEHYRSRVARLERRFEGHLDFHACLAAPKPVYCCEWLANKGYEGAVETAWRYCPKCGRIL